MDGYEKQGTSTLWKMLDKVRRDMDGMQRNATEWSDSDWDTFSHMCGVENEIENELRSRGVPSEYIKQTFANN